MVDMNKIRVGIFFGGPSREREISFAGGRTVYDNLNKTIFEPVPIFVDSNKALIHLDWKYVYKGTIRDFYPPVSFHPESKNGFQIYIESIVDLDKDTYHQLMSEVGTPVSYGELANIMDIAFLALHGEYGEDGQIQSLLQSMGIPYTGSGVLPCAIGMDKGVQKKLMSSGGFACPKMIALKRAQLPNTSLKTLYNQVLSEIGASFVVRPANQGSSIGVSIMHNPSFEEFEVNTLNAFFKKKITHSVWNTYDESNRIAVVKTLSDLRDGLGFPMKLNDVTLYHPEELLSGLDLHFSTNNEAVILESYHQEHTVIFESFINGKEFSCIVIRNEDGKPVALPPTEIRKQGELYDYKSKYLPGLSRKITPMDVPAASLEAVRSECVKLYDYLSFDTYARIDGFITDDNIIYLNDPNTTSGMMPSSFFFHQAAEIGLDPSQFLSFVIRTSLVERIEEQLYHQDKHIKLLTKLDKDLASLQLPATQKKRVAVILGGYSFERHISVESGRNIYEKLASSPDYLPIPIFLKGTETGHELYQIPIPLLLKDNADDIREKIEHYASNPILDKIKAECTDITEKYQSFYNIKKPIKLSYLDLKEKVDVAFIALHGRPGEDGTVQKMLKEVGIPYNGSHTESSEMTINKYNTLQALKHHGFKVANQLIIEIEEYNKDNQSILDQIAKDFTYPLIAKPVDDGCSSAVKLIKSRESMHDYLEGIFRDTEEISTLMRTTLGLSYNEEFPMKSQVLVESLINKGAASHFLEITGGLLTHRSDDGIQYELFEPSEALAGGEILSLEEKFLAGEGQNLTPARFGEPYDVIANQVKADLEKAARILNVEGYARIDAFIRIYPDNKVETIIIEVNSLPGMTPATCIFHQCALNGYKPYDFINKILQYAIND